MKKFKLAALLMCFVALSFAMTSCQKNEDLIIGKWKMTKVEGTNAAFSSNSLNTIWEFKADKTMSMNLSSLGAVTGTYTISGDDLEITMTVLGASQTTKIKIETLNSSTMVWSDPDNASNTATLEKQ